MNIALNTSKLPIMPTDLPTVARQGSGTAEEPRPAMTVSTREFSSVGGMDEVDAAVEAEVSTRDDFIGRLFQQVFNYQPPPMPNFI